MIFRSSPGCLSTRPHPTKRMNLPGKLLQRCRWHILLVPILSTIASLNVPAQTWPPAQSLPEAPPPQPVMVRQIPANLLKDQEAIWTSPARIRSHDFSYLIPLGLMVTVAITTDHQAMSQVVSHNTNFNNENISASNGLLGAFVAAPVVLYGTGHLTDNDHARETGILGGEAMVDSLAVDEVMKVIFMRERPALDGAKGKFFQTSVGADGSFPSTHSFVAWSSAAVLAEEYPSRLNTLGIYGLATGVSLTRVLGQQHFPSDVLVGSAFGWTIGHYVYKKHRRWHLDFDR
jgi:membrane-associated phospholipid phosphatase